MQTEETEFKSWRYRRVGMHVFAHVYPPLSRVGVDRVVTYKGIRTSPRGICLTCGMVQWVVVRRPSRKDGRGLWRKDGDLILPWGQVPQYDGRGLVRTPVPECGQPMPEELVQPMQEVQRLTERAIAEEQLSEEALRREEEITNEIVTVTGSLITPLLDKRNQTIRSAVQRVAARRKKTTKGGDDGKA